MQPKQRRKLSGSIILVRDELLTISLYTDGISRRPSTSGNLCAYSTRHRSAAHSVAYALFRKSESFPALPPLTLWCGLVCHCQQILAQGILSSSPGHIQLNQQFPTPRCANLLGHDKYFASVRNLHGQFTSTSTVAAQSCLLASLIDGSSFTLTLSVFSTMPCGRHSNVLPLSAPLSYHFFPLNIYISYT